MRVILKLLTVAMIILLSACAARRPQIGSADIDWSKRAEEVSTGMTRAEVRHILPIWNGPSGALLSAPVVTTLNGSGQAEVYWVSQDWRVCIIYDFTGGESSDLNVGEKSAKIEKIRYDSAM